MRSRRVGQLFALITSVMGLFVLASETGSETATHPHLNLKGHTQAYRHTHTMYVMYIYAYVCVYIYLIYFSCIYNVFFRNIGCRLTSDPATP